MKNKNDWIVYDGDLISAGESVVSVSSRGLMYGDGVFETFRVYNANSFLLREHLLRLFEGLQILGIPIPEQLKQSKIEALTYQLLQKKEEVSRNAIARLQVWREGNRGYAGDYTAGSHFSLMISQCSDSFVPPTLATVEVKRIPSEALPNDYKYTNGINYILAAKEARAKEASDALMESINGFISETTIANIFWVKGSTVFTPSVDCDLLPGVTRKILIKLLHDRESIKVEEGKFKLSHIMGAEGVWICNSVREVLPVKRINNKKFNTDHRLIHKIQKDYITYRNKHLKVLVD